MRLQVRQGLTLKHLIIPFMLKLDRSLQQMTAQLSGDFGGGVDKLDLVQRWSQLLSMKDFT